MSEREGQILDVAILQRRLSEFAQVRDWEQFHSPKNLVMALSGEVGELSEVFQWLSEARSSTLSEEEKRAAAEELADIQIYLVQLADALGISLDDAVKNKLEANELRYPADEVKGDATKASRRGGD